MVATALKERDVYDPFPCPEILGVRHEPLIVTPVESKRRAGQVIAFLGNQICFFESGTPQPPVGVPVEVMITRPLYYRNDAGGYDWNRLMALLVEAVDPMKHLLVAIEGFECSGSMCSTTALGCLSSGSPISREEVWSGSKSSSRLDVTPGRTHVRVANNVNAGRTWRVPYKQLIPTNVYIERELFKEKRTMIRAAGLTRVEDGEYRHLVKC